MTRTAFTATLENGATFRRVSATKAYSHVLVGRWRSRSGEEMMGALTWCGRLDLAEAQKRRYSKSGFYTDLQIIPVNAH